MAPPSPVAAIAANYASIVVMPPAYLHGLSPSLSLCHDKPLGRARCLSSSRKPDVIMRWAVRGHSIAPAFSVGRLRAIEETDVTYPANRFGRRSDALTRGVLFPVYVCW